MAAEVKSTAYEDLLLQLIPLELLWSVNRGGANLFYSSMPNNHWLYRVALYLCTFRCNPKNLFTIYRRVGAGDEATNGKKRPTRLEFVSATDETDASNSEEEETTQGTDA